MSAVMKTAISPDLYAQLEALPENLTGEIIDGRLYSQPRPAGLHTGVGSGLGMDIGSVYHRGRGGPGGSIEQSPQVAFPIRDVDQAGVRDGFRQIGHDLVPFDPAQAFLDVGLVFGLPSPHPSIEYPQRHPRRGDRQGRMHIQPMLGLVAQPAQPGNPRLRGEIQLGGVLNAQNDRLPHHPLHRSRGMDLQDLAPLHRRVVQQPVGRLGLRTTPAGQRDAPGRLGRQVIHQLDQVVSPPRIPQLQIVKLCLCPTHAPRLPLDDKFNINNDLGFVGKRIASRGSYRYR